MPQQNGTLSVTRGAARPLTAGKCDEKLFPAIGATHPGKTFPDVTALEKLLDGRLDHVSPKTLAKAMQLINVSGWPQVI